METLLSLSLFLTLSSCGQDQLNAEEQKFEQKKMVWFVSEYASIKKYTTRLIGWFTVVQLGANLLKLEPPSSTSQVDVQPPFAADLQVQQVTFGCI